MIYTAGKWVGIAVGVGIALYILFITLIGVGHLGKLFTFDLYRHWKYTTRGLCPKCHKPAALTSTPADQTYGPDRIKRLVCTCGAPSIPMGNRRSADWAGF